TVQRIEDAIKKSLETLSAAPRYITFSGNGEPTLHPEFPTIVDAVTHLRNRLSPSSKIAILSNSSTVHDPAIRETLEKLDVRIMKLDAGCDRTFETYNKPVKGIHLDTICEGLSLLKDVIIQSLFSDGGLGNTTEKNIREWVSRIGQISPSAVQIYTLDRGYPSKSISKCNQNGLRSIQTLLQKIHIHAEVY
ncbi:MAG: radical SAM protein, partial [bacterium]